MRCGLFIFKTVIYNSMPNNPNPNNIDVDKILNRLDKIARLLQLSLRNGSIEDGKYNPLIDDLLGGSHVRKSQGKRPSAFKDLGDKEKEQVWKDLRKTKSEQRKEIDDLQKKRSDLESQINDARQRKAASTTKNKRDDIQVEIDDLKKNLEELNKDLNNAHKENARLNNVRKNRHNDGDEQSIDNYYDKLNQRKGSRAMFNAMSDSERKEYHNDYDEYARRTKKWQEYEDSNEEYRKRKGERNETLSDIYDSGMGGTAFGRWATDAVGRRQRIDNYANFGNYLNSGGAAKIGKAIGGSGAAGTFVTKGLQGLGKGLGFATKALGKFIPGINVFLTVIDLLKTFGHVIGGIIGEVDKYTAEMIKYQAQEEQLQYENAKAIANLTNESKIEDVKYQGDVELKMMDMQSQNLMDAVNLNGQQYVNAMQTAIGPMMQGINATAYQAAQNSISAAAQNQRNLNTKALREGQFERYGQMRGQEYAASKANIQADENIANVDYTTKSAENSLSQEQYRGEHAWQSAVRSNDARQIEGDVSTNDTGEGSLNGNVSRSGDQGAINPFTGQRYATPGRYNNNGMGTDITNIGRNFFLGDEAREGVQAVATETLKYQNQMMRNEADAQKTRVENEYKYNNTRLQYANDIQDKQQETATAVANSWIDRGEEVAKAWSQMAQKIEGEFDKFDRATNNTGISMGITSPHALRSYQTTLLQRTIDTASYYGKDWEDVAKAQAGYVESTGRQHNLGRHDYGQLFGLGKYLGDDNLAAEYGSNMEIFNHGIDTSVDMLDEVLKSVNKIGLNGRKYTKDLVNNLKLANRYNFKDGTRGLMDMAKWAQQTRFNMNSLGSMLDKVQQGGMEGVITQAAGFQVLGGHAAMNSDPLGMLYDAYADPQAYAKRMQDMTKGFGRFNSKTGETEFNINESMMINQLAKLQGRSADEVRQEIMQRNKQTSVESQMSNYQNFTDDQKSLITNKAEYKNGRWVVKMKGGEERDVSNLSQQDLDNLMPTGHDERMEDYMKEVVSALDILTGSETRQKGLVIEGTGVEKFYDEYIKRMQVSEQSFADNYAMYVQKQIENMEKATNSMQSYMEIFKQGNANVTNAEHNIEAQANNIASVLGQTAQIIQAANAKLGLGSGGNINGTPQVPQLNFLPDSNSRANTHTHQSNQSTVSSYAPPIVMPTDATRVNQYVPVPRPIPRTGDSVMSANGNPMMVSASDITPIHDGKVASTDSQDTGLFAKTGGPFDKLFNGIFGKVEAIYNEVESNVNSNYIGRSSESSEYNSYNDGKVASTSTGNQNFSLSINGKIELVGANGQLIDMSDTLRNDPMFVRKMTEMIVSQINNNANGGRNEMFRNRYSS